MPIYFKTEHLCYTIVIILKFDSNVFFSSLQTPFNVVEVEPEEKNIDRGIFSSEMYCTRNVSSTLAFHRGIVKRHLRRSRVTWCQRWLCPNLLHCLQSPPYLAQISTFKIMIIDIVYNICWVI